VTAEGRRGVAALVAGLLIVIGAQLTIPLAGPPLYDGIVPYEPYRWLSPPTGYPGHPRGVSATIGIEGGQNALVAVATPELSPQAQVFAVPGALTLPTGAVSIEVSIMPIPPATSPLDGYIDGNVYRIEVTDEAGTPITAPASQQVSVVLRSANQALPEATIARFDGAAWEILDTSATGAGVFNAVVTEFGDFAVVAPGTSPYGQGPGSVPAQASAATVPSSVAGEPLPSPGSEPWAVSLILITVGVVVVLIGSVLFARRRLRD
jgi:hypothetical protein